MICSEKGCADDHFDRCNGISVASNGPLCRASTVKSVATNRASKWHGRNRIEFRIGIRLGDVIVQPDGDLLGDSVNTAARLQGIAKPGGICLSDDAYLVSVA